MFGSPETSCHTGPNSFKGLSGVKEPILPYPQVMASTGEGGELTGMNPSRKLSDAVADPGFWKGEGTWYRT